MAGSRSTSIVRVFIEEQTESVCLTVPLSPYAFTGTFSTPSSSSSLPPGSQKSSTKKLSCASCGVHHINLLTIAPHHFLSRILKFSHFSLHWLSWLVPDTPFVWFALVKWSELSLSFPWKTFKSPPSDCWAAAQWGCKNCYRWRGEGGADSYRLVVTLSLPPACSYLQIYTMSERLQTNFLQISTTCGAGGL